MILPGRGLFDPVFIGFSTKDAVLKKVERSDFLFKKSFILFSGE